MQNDMKLLFWDIETSANKVYTWGIWEQNAIKVVKPWEMLSYACKLKGKSKITCETQVSAGGEKQMLKGLVSHLTAADVIVGHNMDRFDLKKTRTRLAFHKMQPLPKLATVDTLKVARNLFAFNSNKLEDLGVFLGLGRKVKHRGFDLWEECMEGKSSAFRELARYNKGDVTLLESVYEALLPHMLKHPHAALLGKGCIHCGSRNVTKNGLRAGKQRMACGHCRKSYQEVI